METSVLLQIKNAKLFAGIDLPDIPHMLDCIGGHMRSFSKGEYIFMEGNSLQSVGLLIEGTVQMIKEDTWGDKMILANVVPGDVFGESFVCQDATSSTVSFLASADCQILLLPFRRLLTTCGLACRFKHRLIENMVVLLAAKNIQLMNKMEVLSKKTIREKILVWLSQQTQINGSTHFRSPMGRVELADFLCVDRSALTRELSNMKRDGLLDFDKNDFVCKGSIDSF